MTGNVALANVAKLTQFRHQLIVDSLSLALTRKMKELCLFMMPYSSTV